VNIKAGLVGLPNVGKSTIFNVLTKSSVPAENYPFCTIDPNVAVTDVPDERLSKLSEIYGSKKIIPTIMEFVDIAGLVRGASKGEGLGNQFLANIREVALIIHVVKCFSHSNEKVDPIGDLETIIIELSLRDLESVNSRIAKIPLLLKKSRLEDENKALNNEMDLLGDLKVSIEKFDLNKIFELSKRENLKHLFLLLSKPFIIVANVSESDVSNPESNEYYNQVLNCKYASGNVIAISAKVERELESMDSDLRQIWMNELCIAYSGVDSIIRKSYEALSLISFFTCGPKEVHAWTVKKGEGIKVAAGEIHTDLQRGFISATVISYDDIFELGSEQNVKNSGKLKTVGANYIVDDGDIINVNFNV
jgi:ribosome-binding ATPase